jgi:hypothetical protein
MGPAYPLRGLAIKNYLNNLSIDFDDVVNLGFYKSKTDNKSDMINLNESLRISSRNTKTEFISQVLVSFLAPPPPFLSLNAV